MNLAVPFPPHPHLPAAGPASNTELLWRCGTRGTLWAGCESEIRARPGESRLGRALMPRGQLVALTNVSLETLCDSQPPPAFSSSNYGTNTNKQTLTASLPSSLPPSFPLGFSPVPLCLRKVSRRAGALPVVRDGAGQCPNPGGRCSRDPQGCSHLCTCLIPPAKPSPALNSATRGALAGAAAASPINSERKWELMTAPGGAGAPAAASL